MPTSSTIVLFLGAALLLAAMPGPGLFYIAGRTLAAGRVVEGTNPKTAAFFLALIPQFIYPADGSVAQ